MGNYLPSTPGQQREMLAAIGLDNMEALYAAAPAGLLLKDGPEIPAGKSELEVRRAMAAMAAKNKLYPTIFRGAGAYRHYIPAIVETVAAKETLLTAYTPYQAEISQGILQSIFEYQTMICQLTGMDVSNASVYDGATAAAEAAAMCRDKKRGKTLMSAAAPPEVIETVRSYCWAADAPFELVPARDGATDRQALKALLDDSVACVYIQQPNYFGVIEEAEALMELAHEAGAKGVMGVNPIAAAVLKTPGECGADIAVGEGQPLGMPLSFGGPYLGFMASTTALMRRLPGRIVGQTTDAEGRRAFVLTLQAREQHIRREKAGSNVCSNQALCATTAAAYLAAMGPAGLEKAANQCLAKAHYLAGVLAKAGYPLRYPNQPFFHEFLTECPAGPDKLLAALDEAGILGGLPVDGGILWCATELNTKEEMDEVARIAGEVG